MRELVEELQERFTRPVHILDLHSFPNLPHPYETDRGVRPAFCLGHEPDHAPRRWLRWWDELADGFLASSGGGTAREQLITHNRPFAGSFLPQGVAWGDHGVKSMMLEINRELLVHGRTSTLPPAVRAFGAGSCVRGFLEFVCGDAHAADPVTGPFWRPRIDQARPDPVLDGSE